MGDDQIASGPFAREPSSERLQWLADLDHALGDAERLTIRLGSSNESAHDAAMLLAQIRFAQATLDELRHGLSPEHPDWVELFRSLAELGGPFGQPA